MSLSNVHLTLLVGRGVPLPAPRLLMNALDEVQVRDSAESAQGFTLTFRAERAPVVSIDYTLLSTPLLQPGSRVVICVTLDARPRVLMDGIITHHQLQPSGGAGGTSLTVTGEDLSVLMDMEEHRVSHLPMPDAAIVLLMLAKYAAYGVIPMVIPAPTNWTSKPLEQTSFQKGTDLSYLRELAGRHGYKFRIKPGPLPLTSVAFWGPPGKITKINRSQKALTVDMGPATNVESINFSYNALAPEQVYGSVADPDVRRPVSILATSSTRKPRLASRPALTANRPFVKKVWLDCEGDDPIEAKAKAQDITDKSTEEVVTASGTLDALRYGGVLTAPGIVGLRGAGYSYDGHYHIKSVSHTINRKEYKQSFTLAREGTGSLTQRV